MVGGHNAVAQLRGFTYSAIGQLARRLPALFASDAPVPRTLFAALSQETPEVRVSVQEALSMACSAYKGASSPSPHASPKAAFPQQSHVLSMRPLQNVAKLICSYQCKRRFPHAAQSRQLQLALHTLTF